MTKEDIESEMGQKTRTLMGQRDAGLITKQEFDRGLELLLRERRKMLSELRLPKITVTAN